MIDPSGRWLGTVETLETFTVYQITSDHLVGLHFDEEGVFRIRLHRIRKS